MLKKKAGVSEGHVAKDNDGRRHMVKPFLKKPYSTKFDKIVNKSRETEWWDNIREFIAGDIFSLLLYNKSPNVGLVNIDDDTVAVRSRFLEDAVTLFTFQKDINNEGKTVGNVEKVFAACLIMGDPDFHNQNVMVHQNIETGEYELDKIDHGRSFLSQGYAINQLEDMLNDVWKDYKGEIQRGFMRFDMNALRDAINDMAGRITPEMVLSIVDCKVYELEKAGVELEVNERDQIEDHVKKGLIRQFYNAKAQVAFLDFLKVNHTDWFNQMLNRRDQSFLYQDTNKKFESNIWLAIQSGTRINGMNPLILADSVGLGNQLNNTVIQEYTKKDAYKNLIDSQLIEYAIYNSIEIDGQDPIVYAANNAVKIDAKDPIVYAIENAIKIQEQDPLLYAIENAIKIQGKPPVHYAIENSMELDNVVKSIGETDMMLKIAAVFTSDVDKNFQDGARHQYNKLKGNQLNAVSKQQDPFNQFIKTDAYTIARKIDKFYVSDEAAIKTLSPKDMVYDCDIEVVAKMLEVGKELKKMRNEPFSIASAFNAFVDAISEMWKKVTGAERLSMEDLRKALDSVTNTQGYAIKLDDKGGTNVLGK
ncbi:MAG: hypothetical protein LW826_00910 [Candidatus Jidaibacter sp.]|nr:hypothetical protein [Candidatus Jidaibacter sp.]